MNTIIYKLTIAITLSILTLGKVYGRNIDSPKTKKTYPIDSVFGSIDSILIEYFAPVEVSVYYLTFDKSTIKVRSNYSGDKIISNKDTLDLLKQYVASLFVLGTEKTEIGRTYTSMLEFTGYDKISISLYKNKKLHVTHVINIGMENYKIEFSDTFIRFRKLLRALNKQVVERR